jgi:hypothetical protein
MKQLSLIAAILALAVRATAQDIMSVNEAVVTEAGIYTGRVVQTNGVPAGVAGIAHDLDSVTLVQGTTNIPARVGTRFGFRYSTRGAIWNAPIVLTIVGEHPPIKDPKSGKVLTRDEFKVNSSVYQPYVIYTFDENWEAVPGNWKFEVWHQGKKLCEQSFTVVADQNPNTQK